MEEWRRIPEYEGLYEVSDSGRVRSLDRIITDRIGRVRRLRGCILRPSQVHGRPFVLLSKECEERNFRCAVLVARAFIGERPDGMELCHEDGNSANDRLDNLVYKTHQANMDDLQRHGTAPKGARNSQARLTSSDVQSIRMLDGAYTQRELGELFGVSQSSIHGIIVGKTWAHQPFVY